MLWLIIAFVEVVESNWAMSFVLGQAFPTQLSQLFQLSSSPPASQEIVAAFVKGEVSKNKTAASENKA